MKKVMTIMMMAVVCLIMASCGSKADPKAVADKIAAGETLTQADYTTMIDYCENYAEKAQPYFNTINNASDPNSKEVADAYSELATMKSDAVYLDTFRNALFAANAEQLGEANVKRMDKFSSLEAFPIANISDSAMLNPDVVGDIVDMPDSTNTNVIATGDGEVVKN